MLKPNNTRLCAGTAIAAALALVPTPLLAQQAAVPATVAPEPVLTVSEAVPTTPPPPPQQQPTIVLPPELSVPTIEPAPVADEPVAETEPAGVPPAASEPVAQREPPAPAPRAEAAVPAEAEAAEPEATAPLDVEAIEPLAVPVAEAEPLNAAAPADAGDNTHLWIAIVVGLVAVALAVWGFIAIGRRKPVERKAAAVAERRAIEPVERAPEPVAERTATVTPMPAATARTPAPAPNLAHTGAAVALPSRLPQSFAERDALLRQMIAAKPDRANPFTAPKARLKRARLILQSLGRDFGDREPWIDLSQYPSNWPELARRKHAAA